MPHDVNSTTSCLNLKNILKKNSASLCFIKSSNYEIDSIMINKNKFLEFD